MKVFPVKHIAEIDRYTIKNEPIASVDLMERAAKELFQWIVKNCHYRSFTVCAGFGNNGGDGLAVARMLAGKGMRVNVLLLDSGRMSDDCRVNFDRLRGLCDVIPFRENSNPAIWNECIIDALFGSGLTRPLEGESARVVEFINASGKPVIAIDIPSGLMGEEIPENHRAVVRAENTLTLQFPKFSFFFAENYCYTGKWHVLPIGLHPEAIKSTETIYYYTDAADLASRRKIRSPFDHKGTFGHALLMAGSDGKFGAGVLAARACIHSGAGLTTVHTSPSGMPVFQSAVPEAMGIFSDDTPGWKPFSAIAAGPGMGTGKNAAKRLRSLMNGFKGPLVLDADAITLLSEHPSWLKRLPRNTILTPHPGEMKRLTGKCRDGLEMLMKASELSRKYSIIIVLKGAYTRICLPDGSIWFNPTGNPGMAKGGSGDVLTGILVSLLARGYSPADAAIIGCWLHGKAGDHAARELSEEYISAGDIISYLCRAFNDLYLL